VGRIVVTSQQAPALRIIFEPPAPPLIVADWTDEQDGLMCAYFDERPDYFRIVSGAIELAEQRGGQERAA
jgi:hypothetical protein